MAGVVEYVSKGSLESSALKMAGHLISHRDDTCLWSGDKIKLFLQQSIPSIIALAPGVGSTLHKHRPL